MCDRPSRFLRGLYKSPPRTTIGLDNLPIAARWQVERHDRIRLARRRCALSQVQLGRRLGVHRSAVANWESGASSPSCDHLEQLACVLEVAHEWLATGRGEMVLATEGHGTPAAPADLVENPAERRLLQAWRSLPVRPRAALLDLVEAYRGRRRRKS